MKQGETVRRCKICKRRKQLSAFRFWHARGKLNHSRTCAECQDEVDESEQRAGRYLAESRPERAMSYTTDQESLSVVDVRRIIDGRLPR